MRADPQWSQNLGVWQAYAVRHAVSQETLAEILSQAPEALRPAIRAHVRMYRKLLQAAREKKVNAERLADIDRKQKRR